MRNFLLRDAL